MKNSMKRSWKQLAGQWKAFRGEVGDIWDELVGLALPGSANSEQVNVDWNQVAGQWKQFRSKAKKQWGDLTDSELLEVDGRYDILAEKIQERYGIEREEANSQIDAWANSLNVY